MEERLHIALDRLSHPGLNSITAIDALNLVHLPHS